jgi:hypothetical protein
MPQINVGSANITSFGWSANFDIYNRSITFNLLPFTTGAGLGNTKVAFYVKDQDGVILANIDWTAPQIPNPGTTTSWVLDLSNVNFPFLFQTYEIIGAIQDANGTVYQTNPIYPKICQPNDLNDQGYVPGVFEIIPDCVNSVLTVKERTALVYNSLQPFSVSKNGTLNYPTGSTGPINFATTPFSNNVVYSGQYSISCTTVGTYAIGDDVYVLVSYIANNYTFPVTCANKMANVLCCITKVQQEAIRNCNNAKGENAKQQLQDISLFVMNGLLKEISGQDSQFEVDYIKKYLGCDCGPNALSQSEFTPINPAVTSIVLKGVGGTTVGAPTQTGNTLTYNIASNVYQVTKGNTGDLAFTITIDNSVPNTVKYVIAFNYNVMAGSILTAIGADPGLTAQLNALISAAGGIQGLNGSCVIDLTKTNYSLSQSITGATLITNIVINGTVFAAPANLFAINASAVQSWLNSLSLGVFTVTSGGGIMSILSNANPNAISTMTFAAPNVTQQFQAHNAQLVDVLQAIINYLCTLTDLSIALKNALNVCSFDYNGTLVTTNYPANTTQSAFNAALSNAICNICNRINSFVAFTCTKLQGLFADSPNAVFNTGTDRYLSIMGGACTTMNSKQQAMAFIAAVNAYADVKAAFCAIDCAAPGTCPDISAINASIVGSNIGIYGVTFTQTPLGNQNVVVQFRVHGTTAWTLVTSGLSISPNGNVSGSSPYLIPNTLAPGTTYDVWIANSCGGNGFVSQVTTPTGTVYSAAYRFGTVLGTICEQVPGTLYSSTPFGPTVIMYTDAGLSTPLTGNNYIAPVGSGEIFNLNPGNGQVGADTGSNCGSGTAGTYILGNNTATICGGSPVTLYTAGAFAPGGILYQDAALTTIVTGSAYVVQNSTNRIFNLNSSTGVIGSDTGTLCSATATLTFSFTNAGGSFLNFAASLNRTIDAPININKVFADGFNNGACSGGAVSSAQKNSTMVINAGSMGVGAAPDLTSGSWASASHYSMYNLLVNGVPHVNGDTVVIGSYTVTIVLPACN